MQKINASLERYGMNHPGKVKSPIPVRLEKILKSFIEMKRPWSLRFAFSVLMALLSFLLIAYLYNTFNMYLPSIVIFSSILITVYGGIFLGITWMVILSLITDYYFIAPVGAIFSSPEDVLHFVIILSIEVLLGFVIFSFQKSLEIESLAKQEAQSAVRARDSMIGVISHELKNPLTALGTGVELLKRILPKDPEFERAHQLAERLEPSIKRMDKLISDLLDVTRLDARKLKLDCVACDLFEIVKEVIQSLEASAQEKLIELRSQVEPNCHEVYCDPERTIQVLTNLVNNAIKFTNSGGTILIYADQSENDVDVRVIDNGRGIAEENLPHIFDRFWQVKGAEYRGTGLGLAIVKGIVEAQGGEIWAESKIGEGSTFHFTLPKKSKGLQAKAPQAA